jgi:hypothetical protein
MVSGMRFLRLIGRSPTPEELEREIGLLREELRVLQQTTTRSPLTTFERALYAVKGFGVEGARAEADAPSGLPAAF